MDTLHIKVLLLGLCLCVHKEMQVLGLAQCWRTPICEIQTGQRSSDHTHCTTEQQQLDTVPCLLIAK